MKITNNEIVVYLPERPKDIDAYERLIWDETLGETKKINKPLVVDVEAMARVTKEFYETECLDDAMDIPKLAQHLAANLDKWMVEKKEGK